MDPKALTVDQLAKLLTDQGNTPGITSAAIRDTLIPAGLPISPQGTINLIEVTAWLAARA